MKRGHEWSSISIITIIIIEYRRAVSVSISLHQMNMGMAAGEGEGAHKDCALCEFDIVVVLHVVSSLLLIGDEQYVDERLVCLVRRLNEEYQDSCRISPVWYTMYKYWNSTSCRINIISPHLFHFHFSVYFHFHFAFISLQQKRHQQQPSAKPKL